MLLTINFILITVYVGQADFVLIFEGPTLHLCYSNICQHLFLREALFKKISHQMWSLNPSWNKDPSILPCVRDIRWWSSKIGLVFCIVQHFWQVWIQIVQRFSNKIIPFSSCFLCFHIFHCQKKAELILVQYIKEIENVFTLWAVLFNFKYEMKKVGRKIKSVISYYLHNWYWHTRPGQKESLTYI